MVFPIVGGTQSTGFEIDGSYMIDDAAASGLARFGNNSRDGNTFTIAFWVKRTKLGASQLVNSKVEDSGVNSFVFAFDSSDRIDIGGQPASGSGAGGHRTVIVTNNRFRDTAAWYHIVYRQDTTQSTASNRHRLYVNGVETDNGTYAALDQNVAFAYFYNASSYPYAIGNDERDNTYANYYMADHHYTDGVSNEPGAFAETNDNGVWVPKQYTGSHGSYGHYLKFLNSDGGSGTTAIGGHNYTTGSASTIGADSSGNGNHFHVQGYGTKNRTTDSPSNTFATWNILDTRQGATFAEGALKVTTGSSQRSYVTATQGVKNGKWYMEIKSKTAAGSSYVGFCDLSDLNENTANTLGDNPNEARVNDSGSFEKNNSTTSGWAGSFDNNDIISLLLDADNNRFTVAKNGQYADGSGNYDESSPTAYITFTAGNFMTFACGDGAGAGSVVYECNFGNPMFDISSGNADANGHGNFEYAPPSGYFALCSKNLAETG